MRTINRLLVIISILAFSGCQSPAEKPGLFIRDGKRDLSVIKFDSQYVINYTLINTGKGLLMIDTATASCGCTIPRIDKRKIQAGDSGILTVAYQPVDTGNFDKKVIIKSNIDSSFSIVSFRGKAVK